MKVLLLGTLMALTGRVSAQEVPADYAMECRRNPHLSDELGVRAVDDRLEFHLSSRGGFLEKYKRLVDLPADADWGISELSFSFPLDHCRQSTNDSMVVSCFSPSWNPLALDIMVDTLFDGGRIERRAELTGMADVRVRRIYQENSL